MINWYPLLAVLAVSLTCAYLRTSLRAWTIAGFVAIAAVAWLAGTGWLALILTAALFAAITLPLNLPDFRRQKITAPLLKIYQKITPQLSDTERVALEAGTVGFEGELFSGKPDWKQLLRQPAAQLTIEEQAFLDGPCEELCHMINDWEITHERADLPPELWEFLKKNRFFGMIIPKEYGGLQFSALANSAVLQKISTLSATVCSTVGVPNSLGPAELLLHYGTKEQKEYYLPRLADGREIPCFALTGPYAGSDATSIPDYGVVCKGEWQGGNVLGVRHGDTDEAPVVICAHLDTIFPEGTPVGVSRDGNTMLLVTVDGRSTRSVGMTLVELATLMRRLGAWQAMNFDGGGSTTMVIGGAVVNVPSDSAGERAVGNALFVMKKR